MSRRISLREFQEQLSRASRRPGPWRARRCGCVRWPGTERWMVELPDAGEVVSVPELTPVPRTRPWFRGIANVRGALFSVVDLAGFLGQAPIRAARRTAASCWSGSASVPALRCWSIAF